MEFSRLSQIDSPHYWCPPLVDLPLSWSVRLDTDKKPIDIGSGRSVYRGIDHYNCECVVQFCNRTLPNSLIAKAPQKHQRYAIALDKVGWPKSVIVTPLCCRVGDYTITDFLGIGGMGEVWRAENAKKQFYAIKFSTLENDSAIITAYSPDNETRLAQHMQAKAERQCIDSIVVKAHEVLQLDTATAARWAPLAVVMDYVPVTLRHVLDEKISLPEGVISSLLKELIHILEVLHRRLRLVHRDLKPDNLFLKMPASSDWKNDPARLKQATLLLGDLATVVPDKTPRQFRTTGVNNDSAVALGQDRYKARELGQLNASGELLVATVSPQQDLYSLGVIAEELLQLQPKAAAWLQPLIHRLQHSDPAKRGRAGRQLQMLARPDGRAQLDLLEYAGWDIDKHSRLVGREWVLRRFKDFQKKQRDNGRGGVFLIQALAGIGKSAILTDWAPPESTEGGPAAAFYFCYNKPAFSRPDAFLNHLGRSLARRLDEQNADRSSEFTSDDLAKLVVQAAETATEKNPLMLIVDGVDECSNPTEACRELNQLPLPPHTYLVLGARPTDANGNDPCATLDADHRPEVCVIDPTSELNIEAGAKFWCEEWETLDPATRQANGIDIFETNQAKELVQNSGGIFMILRSAFELIARGELTLQQFIDQEPCQTVTEWHRQQWDRIRERLNPEAEQKVKRFCSLVMAAQDFLSEEQILDILDWDNEAGQFNDTVDRVTWLLEERRHQESNSRIFRYRHKSVPDFFLGPGGPLQGTASIDMHARISDFYLELAPDRWSELDEYGRRFLVQHCVAAGQGRQRKHAAYIDRAVELMSDLRFLDVCMRDES